MGSLDEERAAQEEAKQAALRQKQAEHRRLYREVFDSKEGRLVLEDIRLWCSVDVFQKAIHDTSNGRGLGPVDPSTMLFQQGRESTYRFIVDKLKGPHELE